MRSNSRFLSLGASIAINAAILGVLVRVLAAPSKPAEVRIAVELEPTPISHAVEIQPPKPAPPTSVPQRLPDKASSPNPPRKKSEELRFPPLRILGASQEMPSIPATGGPRADGLSIPGAGTDIGGGTPHTGPGAASVTGNDGGATLVGGPGSGKTSGPVVQPVKPQPEPPRIEPPKKKPEPPAPKGETRGVKPAKQPQPAYPADAKDDGVEGTVVLVATVDADGRVAEVRLEKGSGDRRLDRAAEKEIRQWTYTPALKDGVPVKSSVRVRVEFRLE